MRFLIVTLLFLWATSCSSGYGNKLESDELVIFYENQQDESIARALGHFWKEEGLIGERQQTLRLFLNKVNYRIQLIQSPEFQKDPISFEEQQLLIALLNKMDTLVFENRKGSFEICNDHFEIKHLIQE